MALRSYSPFEETVDYTTGSSETLDQGDFKKIGDIIGYALSEAGNSELVGLVVRSSDAVLDISSLTIAAGDKLYATSTGTITKTASGNSLIAVAKEAATNSATSVRVIFDGRGFH